MSHRPRKRFGQHFLDDKAVIERLLAAINPQAGEQFVEIGPGQGALTYPLLRQVDELHVIELDRDLAARLQSKGGLHVHQADALEFDFTTLSHDGRLRVVGNLPYNISTPLMFHVLEQRDVIRDMHFMLQQEVVARLAATPGSKDYGRLSVMAQYRARVERLFGVPPEAFNPPPKVDSAVVRLDPYREAPVAVGSEVFFARLVKHAFAQRRKMLRNALSGLLSESQIAEAGVDPKARAETLSLELFAALSRQACN